MWPCDTQRPGTALGWLSADAVFDSMPVDSWFPAARVYPLVTLRKGRRLLGYDSILSIVLAKGGRFLGLTRPAKAT